MVAARTKSRYSWHDFAVSTRPRSAGEVAERAGVSLRTIERWKKHGIPEPQVDNVACAYCSHPGVIWPHQWWQNVSEDDD